MAQVQQSPGLISTPTIESQGFVGAQPMRPDMSFIKYGQKALGNLRDAAKVYSDYQEEQRKKAMEARVAEASSEYYKRCMEKLVGKDGALLQKEYDVVKGYDGKSFTQYWGEKIDGIANDIISESADPELRQAFLKSIRGYRDSFYGQLFGHEGSEGRKYAESSFRVQGDVASDQVSRGQNLSGAFGTIVDSLTRVADLQGKNVKDKTVKEAIRRDAQAAYAKSLEIHVTDLLSQGDIDRAMAAAQTAVRAGAIDGNAYNTLQTKLKEGYDLYQAKAITESTISRIRESNSPAGVLWSVAASEGYPDAALDQILGEDHPLFAQGSDSGKADREVLRARGIQAMDKLIVDCGGTTNASYYLAAGSEARAQELRQMWEKANSELDAADQRPSGSFTWADAEKFMTPEEKAKQKRIAKGFDRGMAQTKKMGLQDFYREAKAANPTVSDDVLAASAAQAKSDYDKKQVLVDVKKQGTLDEIIRRFSSGDMDLTGMDMSQFSTEEKADIAELRRTYSANIVKENPELTLDLLYDPERLMALTETQFTLLKAHTSPEEWNLLREKREYYKNNGGVGDGDVSSSDVKLAVTRWAYTHPEHRIDDDPKARARAEKLAYVVISDAAKKRASKDPLTQEQMIKLVDDRLSAVYAKTSHSGGLIGFRLDSDSWGVTKSFASFGQGWLLDVITTGGLNIMKVNGDTLGAEGRKFLAKVFQQNEANLRSEDYNVLFDKFVYDQKLRIPKDALPEPKDDPDVEKLLNEFVRINKRPPSYELLCQMWLFKKAGFGTALDRYMGRKLELKPRIGSISYEDFYDSDASMYKDTLYGTSGVD